jgi:hypothetical protein
MLYALCAAYLAANAFLFALKLYVSRSAPAIVSRGCIVAWRELPCWSILGSTPRATHKLLEEGMLCVVNCILICIVVYTSMHPC